MKVGLVGLNVVGILVGETEYAVTPPIVTSKFVGLYPLDQAFMLYTTTDSVFCGNALPMIVNDLRAPQQTNSLGKILTPFNVI